MTSKLNTDLFNKRLQYRTRNGYPFYIGPLQFLSLFFNQTKHSFVGAFDDEDFELSNNSFYRIPFVIAGTYKENKNGETEVKYKMKTNYYSFFWIHTITILVVSINLNYILRGADPIVLINILIILIFLLRYIAIYQKKSELEENFIEIFEITYN